MTPSTPLAGRVAVVTGGTGGIGTAIVARLAREGATVIAADLQDNDHRSDASVFCALDVTSEDSVTALAARVRTDHGRLDILVNAAGIEILSLIHI